MSNITLSIEILFNILKQPNSVLTVPTCNNFAGHFNDSFICEIFTITCARWQLKWQETRYHVDPVVFNEYKIQCTGELNLACNILKYV